MHCRAVLCGQRRAGFAKSVGGVLRQPDFIAPLAEPPSESCRVNGLPYSVTRYVRSPHGLAATTRASVGSHGFSDSIAVLVCFLPLLGTKRNHPPLTCWRAPREKPERER